MRRIVGIAAIGLALAGCGSGASRSGDSPIVFGITGGNIAPYAVSIQPSGRIHTRGRASGQIPPAQVRQLQTEIRQAHLTSRSCAGALPDVATRYIRIGYRRVTLHGDCERSFVRVWNDLARSVGLRAD